MKNFVFIIIIISGPILSGQVLEWNGDPANFLPPGDITISYGYGECTNEFEECLWSGKLEGESVASFWNWEVIHGVHYDGCDVDVSYTHVPCAEAIQYLSGSQQEPPALLNTGKYNVCVTLFDKCDSTSLEYCFGMTLECDICMPGLAESICSTCAEVGTSPLESECFFCNPSELRDGLISCLLPCEDPNCPPLTENQPETLCGQEFFYTHNPTWFAFVASAEQVEIDFFIYNCVGGGIQVGLYSSCDFTQPCVSYFVNCAQGIPILRPELIIGQTYYLFVDGCNGSTCEFEVTIDNIEVIELDEVDAITAYSSCRDSLLTNDFSMNQLNASVTGNCAAADRIYVYPGEEIQFDLLRQGRLGSFPKGGIACDYFSTELPVKYSWSASWGLTWDIDFSQDTYDYVAPLVTIPTQSGNYSLCLDSYSLTCWELNEQRCIDIIVEEDSLLVPYSPMLTCEIVGNDEVLVSWTEDPLLSYELDVSGIAADLELNYPTGNSLIISGYDGSCYNSMVTIEVYNPLISECNSLRETVSCRPLDLLTLELLIVPDYDTLLTCLSNDTLELIVLDANSGMPLLGSWENVIDDSLDTAGFIIIDSTMYFLADSLEEGTYEALFTYTYDNLDCTELLPVAFTIGGCGHLDQDGDGLIGDDDCDDNDPNVFPGNEELCDSLDNNCNGLIDEGIEQIEPIVIECSSTSDSTLLFRWNYPVAVLAFSVKVNDEPPYTTFNNYIEVYEVTDEVTIVVTAILTQPHPCGDISSALTCAFVSSVENNLLESISIYPNPTSSRIHITSSVTELNYQIYNLGGYLLKQGKLSPSAIDLEDLPVGVYLLRLTSVDNKFSATHRLMKL